MCRFGSTTFDDGCVIRLCRVHLSPQPLFCVLALDKGTRITARNSAAGTSRGEHRRTMSIERLGTDSQTPIRMLLVEDSEHDAEFIAMMFQRVREIVVDIDRVASLSDAVEACHRKRYDIVLLDLGLPDSTGMESVARLRVCSPNTPIVVLTGDDRSSTGMAAIEAGAQDYLTKQHVVAGLLTRMVRHSIKRHNRLIQAQSEALLDGLTGLANRRACDAEIQRRLTDFQRHQHSFCVALFDIDHFKSFNDQWGHEVGDQVIRAVGNELARPLRATDHVARFGGEEFAMVLSMTRLADAERVVLRSCRSISELLVGQQQLHVTVSCGLAEVTGEEDARSLLSRTDEALYAAKRGGRDCLRLHNGAGVVEGLQPIDGAQTLAGKQ